MRCLAAEIGEQAPVKYTSFIFKPTYIIDRIRPPKREQVQFLFPSLGCYAAAARRIKRKVGFKYAYHMG
jgi:hypothetical protein